MHLKQLKLAGFKSFVDSTVIEFPGVLTAVVGPNGCGKSNTIDAVRWVLGEGSAKNLRSIVMTDVIFNGSSHRKPIGQASVELVFDNRPGRLTGPYASYQEIAIKRVLTRDGVSSYYLNGTRCRRRDITDLFAGTGAGTRGYAIIGQEMISRLIEGRPDELRAYLDEAAGVSKYKERRRETVQRIAHTRDNLARVADVCGELDKQLERLARQAQAAERFKLLKHNERLCKADILVLKWQALQAEEEQVRRALTYTELQHEQLQAKISTLFTEEIHFQEASHQLADSLIQLQSTRYQLGSDIARLESSIVHQQQERQRLTTEQQYIQEEYSLFSEKKQQNHVQLQEREQRVQVLKTQLQAQYVEWEACQQQRDVLQQQESDWKIRWQAAEQAFHVAQREQEILRVRLDHLQSLQQEARIQCQADDVQELKRTLEHLQQDAVALQTALLEQVNQQALRVKAHENAWSQETQLQQLMEQVESELNQTQDQLKKWRAEQAALAAVQQALLAKLPINLDGSEQGKPRVFDVIAVEEAWLAVCEWVLGESTKAIVLNSLDELWPMLPALQGQSAHFVTPTALSDVTLYPRLSDQIQGIKPAGLLSLDQVFTAGSLEEALSWLPSLRAEQSIVTVDGYWLGNGWVRILGQDEEAQEGMLARQQTLVRLEETLWVTEESLMVLQARRDELHMQIVAQKKETEQLARGVFSGQEAVYACEAKQQALARAIEDAQLALSARQEAFEQKMAQLETWKMQEIGLINAQQTWIEQACCEEKKQQQLMHTKSQWEASLVREQDKVDVCRATIHQIELQVNREQLQVEQMKTALDEGGVREAWFSQRLEEIAHHLQALDTPDSQPVERLEGMLVQRDALEQTLGEMQEQADVLRNQLSTLTESARGEKAQLGRVQGEIRELQMQAQAFGIRSAHLVDTLSELGVSLQERLPTLPEPNQLAQREEELQDIERQLQRLGAVNLVAIEEYESEQRRKSHLDSQCRDLTDALSLLEQAIEKMDQETLSRLKDTFEQVNQVFQQLFPRLFGGGRALLQWTCDNLLEAGVVVMAQPPGKRNSTIQMLSGGEKAMTAIALVFAIFQLNPSPFCMLDEVDAPLDEVNVRRFCQLVREMSNVVQFLLITHNKVTMELADHLIGVTMREPGVSRVVMVDVEQALSMVE